MPSDRVCSSCGSQTLKLFAKQGRWRCINAACGDDFPFQVDAIGSTPDAGSMGTPEHALAGLDVERLPSVIAIPLSEYAAEKDPLLCLWRMCDTIELTLRLVVAVAVADVLRASEQVLPAKLRATLAEEIDEPTLAGWRAMARELANQVHDGAVVPEITHFVTGSLEPFLRGPELVKDRTVETSLASLRNQLAHGGGITRSVASKLLKLHAPRFEEVMRAGAWLREIELVTPRNDGLPAVLRGPHPGLRTFRPAGDAVLLEVRRASQAGDGVVLVRGTRVLSLWPFTVYGLPASSNPDALPPRVEVPQIYCRRGLLRLELTPVGSMELAQSEGSEEALRLFEGMFRREQTVATSKWRVPGWEASLRRDSKKLVGREAEIAALRNAIDETQAGVLWLTGSAGIGKSILMARVACDLIDDAKGGEVVLPFRFKVGDGRCSQAAFLEFAIERLRATAGAEADADQSPRGKQRTLVDQLGDLLARIEGRVVLLLDGLDEIATSAPDFASKVPLGLAGPNIIWVCAGRGERGLAEAFSSLRCRHVFGHGVPRMSTDDIRCMLVRRLGFLTKELARSDHDTGGRVENPFIAAVEKNAEGLPIYVEYVIGDICTRRIQVLDERARLPASLAAYHEDMLKRCQVGSLQLILTPLVCLLAVAHEPLTEDALHALLVHWLRISTGSDGRSLLHMGLGAVQPILRLEWTPAGVEGYSLFHHSLRDHMETSETSREAMAIARRVVGDAALAWAAMGKTAAATYLFRQGVAHLHEHGRVDDAALLLTTFGYLMRRLGVLPTSDVVTLLTDYELVTWSCNRREVAIWEDFLRERRHVLLRGNPTWPADRIFLQLALDHADDSRITHAAEAWLIEEPPTWPIMRLASRPSTTSGGRAWLTLEGHRGAVSGVLHYGPENLLSYGHAEIRLWHTGTAGCLHVLGAHDLGLKGACVIADDRILSYGEGGLQLWDTRTGARLAAATPLAPRWEASFGSADVVPVKPDGILVLHDRRIVAWQNVMGGVLVAVLDGTTLETHSSTFLSYWSDEFWDYPRVEGMLEIEMGRVVMWPFRSGGSSTRECVDTVALETACTKTVALSERTASDYATVELTTLAKNAVGAIGLNDRLIALWHGWGQGSLWDRRTSERVGPLSAPHQWGRFKKAPLVSGDRLVTWHAKSLFLCSTEDGAVLAQLDGHTSNVQGVEALDGYLVSWDASGEVRRWSLDTGAAQTAQRRFTFPSDEKYGCDRHVAPLAKDCVVVCARSGDSGNFVMWDPETNAEPAMLESPGGRISGVIRLSSDRFVTWGHDGAVRIWNASANRPRDSVSARAQRVSGLMGLPDGRLVTWGEKPELLLRRSDGSELRSLAVHGRPQFVRLLGHSRLLTWAPGGGVQLWDIGANDLQTFTVIGEPHAVVSGERLLAIREPSGGCGMLSWEEDDWIRKRNMGIIESEDYDFSVIDLKTGASHRMTASIQAGCRPNLAHETPDGWLIFLLWERTDRRSESNDILIWQPEPRGDLALDATQRDTARPGRGPARLVGHRSAVRRVIAMNDGRFATESADNQIRIWQATEENPFWSSAVWPSSAAAFDKAFASRSSSAEPTQSSTVAARGANQRCALVAAQPPNEDSLHCIWDGDGEITGTFASPDGHITIIEGTSGESGNLRILVLYRGTQRIPLSALTPGPW